MVAESILACFATGTLGDLECILGGGFMGIFGYKMLATLALMFVGAFLAFKLHLPMELIAVFMLSLAMSAVGTIVPQWVQWVILIPCGIIAFAGVYKFVKSRG